MYMASGGGLGGGREEACLQPNCDVLTPKTSPSLAVFMNFVLGTPFLSLERPNLRTASGDLVTSYSHTLSIARPYVNTENE